jgi:FdhD protein
MSKPPVSSVSIVKRGLDGDKELDDLVVAEEPLEIKLGYGNEDDRAQMSLSVTMRTPGHDLELVAGFLFAEGIIDTPGQLLALEHCQNVKLEDEQGNVVRAELSPAVELDLELLQRNSLASSSCGVCGKSSIEALAHLQCESFPKGEKPALDPEVIKDLPRRLRESQTVFRYTGGIHATGLFDLEGNLALMREDVGRHNALDKVIGAKFLQDELPLSGLICLCSGRLGFELVQKSLRAGLPILAAVGAPSSLAVETASQYGMTLLGFVREGRFNEYLGTTSEA